MKLKYADIRKSNSMMKYNSIVKLKQKFNFNLTTIK